MAHATRSKLALAKDSPKDEDDLSSDNVEDRLAYLENFYSKHRGIDPTQSSLNPISRSMKVSGGSMPIVTFQAGV